MDSNENNRERLGTIHESLNESNVNNYNISETENLKKIIILLIISLK